MHLEVQVQSKFYGKATWTSETLKPFNIVSGNLTEQISALANLVSAELYYFTGSELILNTHA